MSSHTIPPAALDRREAVLAAVRILHARRARRGPSLPHPLSRRFPGPAPRTWL